jgi:SAM-dependent methyltransferase
VDNRSFWDKRYSVAPQLGSGRGSRGYAAVRKNELVRRAIREHKITSILDIGCGDLCWLDGEIAEACIYLGCDISEIIIERNTARHVGVSSPRFTVHDIAADPLTATADLLICFDVLIHQIDKARFDYALRNIVSAIRKVALVSYLTPPSLDGTPPTEAAIPPEMQELENEFTDMLAHLPRERTYASIAFHGPLPDFVRSIRDDLQAEPIGRYRWQTVYEIMPRGNMEKES